MIIFQTVSALECPANSVYSACTSRCPQTCSRRRPEMCDPACIEGCKCIRGHVLSGDECVPRENCGCDYRGEYYKVCLILQGMRGFNYARSSNSKSTLHCNCQRWRPRGRPWPRGHILKSLALASKPQVLENCPALSSRTALFFEQLKFCWKTPETSRKICEYLFSFLFFIGA